MMPFKLRGKRHDKNKREDKLKSEDEKIGEEEPEIDNKTLFSFCNLTDNLTEQLEEADRTQLEAITIVAQNGIQFPDVMTFPAVKELWITECCLKEVPRCYAIRLEKLFLHENELDVIPDLSYLENLKVLWLNDNRITSVENLSKCSTIEDLNLANNNIKCIDSINQMENLTHLNLSGNPINHIESVKSLKKLPNLRHLMLADPLYRICPISNMLNYRTAIVYNMPNLTTLDTFLLDENEIKNAQEYYRLKKIQYSNTFHKLYNDFYENLTYKTATAKAELRTIKDRIVETTLKEKQATLTGNKEMLEKCKWEQRHRETDILRWDTSYIQQGRQQEAILQLNMKVQDFEMSYAGNVQFVHYGVQSEVTNLCQLLFYEYACPLSSREAYVEKIVVDGVTHIIDKVAGSNCQLEVVNKLKFKGSPSKFYLLVEPLSVNNIDKWPFDFLTNYFNRYTNEDYERESYMVTNCVAIADSAWLNSNEIHKKVFLTNEKNSKRLAVVVCVPSTSYTQRLDLKMGDLHQTGSKTKLKCHKLKVNAHQTFPVFVVQFHYVYQDLMKDYEFLIKSDTKKAEKVEAVDASILDGGSLKTIEQSKWKQLSALELTKCMMTSFNITNESFPNIKSLDVSFNYFEKLDEFSSLFPCLDSLNVSYNNISNLTTIKGNKNLEKLNISWNNLTKLTTTLHLLKLHTPNLKYLDVSYNSFKDINFYWHEPYIAKKVIPTLKKYNDKWLIELDAWKEKTFEGIYDLPVVDQDPTTHIAGTNGEWAEEPWCQLERTRTSHVCVSKPDRSVSCLSLIGGHHFYHLRFSLDLPVLTSLTVSSNLLSHTAFLAQLPSLRRIDFSKNLLTSNNVHITNNPHLIYLDLSCNYLNNLDFLSKMQHNKLVVLNVSMNNISTLKGLENCSRLEQLYLVCNSIKSYESIKNIKNLQRLIIIDIACNKLPSFRDTKKFISDTVKTIEYINGSQICDTEVIDVPSVNNTLDAEYLLRYYKITALHNITELTVVRTYITRVNLDGGMVNHLTSINLEGNQIDRLCDLACLPYLTNLCLSFNRVKRFRGREDDYIESTLIFHKLETLHLDNNGIMEIESLELTRMPALKTLFLQDNLISALNGLHKAKSLVNLILDRNRVRAIQTVDLTGLHSLSQLYLENNYIENLQFLSSIPKLTKLFVANNRIYDLVNMHWLTCTKQITELTISGNPVNSCGNLLMFLLQTLPQLSALNGFTIRKN